MTEIMEWSMILKIMGSLMVIAASSLGGWYASGLDSFRIHDLNEIKKALTILKSEIEFASAPLPEALRNIAARTDKPINTIFTYLSERLEERSRESISDLWFETIESCKSSTFFHRDDIESLQSFGKTLGYLDKKMQISAICLLIENIDAKVDTLSAAAQKNSRMYRSLGVLGGMLIAVIFI